MENLEFGITLDFSQANAEVAALQQKVDKVFQNHRTNRAIIMQELRDIQAVISIIRRSLSLIVEATGMTIDPVENALLSMISSSAGLMIAIATAMNTTGVLAPIGLTLMAVAFEFQVFQTLKLIRDTDYVRKEMQNIQAQLDSLKYLGGPV